MNPLIPAELVIDHSVIADVFGRSDAFARNVDIEYSRNSERYRFLRWGQQTLEDFAVVPPGVGIMHQVNIEYLARVVMVDQGWAFPDVCLGTDSHTTMVNGLGVLGWGIGGIEAEAVMLGESLSMLLPRVLGFRLHGELPEGATATDLVLTITEMLRARGVVGKFVEFYGPGLSAITLADRATISNMSPEFGSTCAYFPIDEETLRYLRFTGRPEETVDLVETYAKVQGLWHDPAHQPVYSELAELDLGRSSPRSPARAVPRTGSASTTPNAPSARSCRRSWGSSSPTRAAAEVLGRRGLRGVVPGQRSARDRRGRGRPVRTPGPGSPSMHEAGGAGRASADPAEATRPGHAGRAGPRRGPRQRRHRGHHLVHEHLQPLRHGRRRAARQERRRPRPRAAGPGSRRASRRDRRW